MPDRLSTLASGPRGRDVLQTRDELATSRICSVERDGCCLQYTVVSSVFPPECAVLPAFATRLNRDFFRRRMPPSHRKARCLFHRGVGPYTRAKWPPVGRGVHTI